MRILIAEDDPISRRVLEATLRKWGYDVTVTCDGAEAWTALQADDAPRLAILDWMMPGMEGVEITRRIRQLDRKDYTFIILLTARDKQKDILEGMRAGADDYVIKPFDVAALKARLRAAARILSLHAELLATQEALQREATHDRLTGLWNRGAIFDLLTTELIRGRREETWVSVIMADIDHFKYVNDTYGHAAGDAVLRKTARTMEGILRPYDHLGRYGGEEFLVVSPGCELADTATMAERIRLRLEGATVCVADHSISLTTSLGVAAWRGPEDIDAETLVRLADQAMYQSKQNGRNQVHCAAAMCDQ